MTDDAGGGGGGGGGDDVAKAMEFFCALSGRLRVKLTEAPTQVSERILNQVASPSAQVLSVSMTWEVYLSDAQAFREVTKDEWTRVALREPKIRMHGESEEDVMEHVAPDGTSFTVRDLANAVEETERQSRNKSSWLGGVDVHHVYFEGIHLEEDGVWGIHWGS